MLAQNALSGTPADEGAVDVGGTVVLTTPMPRYASLADATKALVGFVREGETARIRAARALQNIRDAELYREAGATSFKAFMPVLCEQLDGVGIKSASAIKRALMLADLFLDELALDELAATKSIGHLNVLHRLADLDRKTGELRIETEKTDKLNAPDFEEATRLVVALVTVPTKAQKQSGLSVEETAALLDAADLGSSTELFERLTNRQVSLPAGGWSLANTQALVDAVVGGVEDEDEDGVKLNRVWVGEDSAINASVFVGHLSFRRGEAEVEVIEIGKTYPRAVFELMKGSDDSEIAGEEK